MYKNDEFIRVIKDRLSDKRFQHSLNVAASAKELARKFGADEEKAYTAGILHDIMKEENIDIQREYMKKNGEDKRELEFPNHLVYHQMSGAAYCRLELGIDDEDILSAIRYHTTGRSGMTLLEKVVYTADFISADRSYPDVAVMREKAKQSLEDAMLYSLRYTISDLTKRAKPIHIDTVECYNDILENFKEKDLDI
ncbi:MAG: bis(5'-nucleosyl)-tetraphosphatase (symmetrical) YqeK [Eubacterium sp.]|nr:bis(5'-nucleosyl)-tetraphosphatase (symmetrical) YqeK [Eubacterium sp.]